MSENKIKITHGIYIFNSKEKFYCRNTSKYLPLPLKIRDLIREKYLHWWYIKTSIYRFGKRISVERYMDQPIEFTVAECPEKHITVISICHPLDQFKRKISYKIAKERMEFAIKYPKNDKSWSYQLK